MWGKVSTSPGRRNLLVFHLESINWQRVQAFPEAFPNLTALMEESRTYRACYASATSTQMVMAAFLHGNDFEMDAAPEISAPAGNQPGLFGVLEEAGYSTAFLVASALPGKPILKALAGSLPAPWATHDFGALLNRLDATVVEKPFAVYVWSLVPHMEANLALAPHARSVGDLVAGSCAVVDNLLGATIEILRRRDLLSSTTIVVFGDHGDDFWTHGFKNGMLHGVEPYTPLVHVPLVIRDPDIEPGIDRRLVSTVDLRSTCLDLLGLPNARTFAHGGGSILDEPGRTIAFSQNFTAGQRDSHWMDVRKTFAAIDASHALLVSSRGLELYDIRLDPGNHANILNFYALKPEGRLEFTDPASPDLHRHFGTVRHLWRADGRIQEPFTRLRDALKAHVLAKNAYAAGTVRDDRRLSLLDLGAFDRINRAGRSAFFGGVTEVVEADSWRRRLPAPLAKVVRRVSRKWGR